MIYRVVITEKAKDDLRAYYLHAAQHYPLNAGRWLNQFNKALTSLSKNPLRCGLAAENEAFNQEIRQLLFGKRKNVFRALFVIDEGEVRVLHIRRATMDAATPDDVFE